jgi:lipoyl(octanoyl) transferase
MMSLVICPIECMPYDQALRLQYDLVAARQANRIGNILLLLEHPPVITLGTRADPANIYLPREQLAAAGVQIHEVNRGGDVTYHGPGQLVGYPIFQLKDFPQGVRWFVQQLEMSLIDLLQAQYGIAAHFRQEKYTGVWVGDKKIAAFGLAITRGVTMHGFAFNINTNLQHFDWINPCGLSMGVTSVAKELGHAVVFAKARQLTALSIAEHFGQPVEWLDWPALQALLADGGLDHEQR